MTAACTIVSPNYLPFARTLAGSWREHHPADPFFVLLVADLPADFHLAVGEPFTAAIPVSAIGIPGLRVEAMKYDILELNTNVKPAFLQHLFRTHPALNSLIYLDPDIRLFAPLAPVLEAFAAGAAAVLTPHVTFPIADLRSPSEQDLLFNGTYNLGFIGLRRSPAADALLAWWNRRCLDLGFSEGRTGLFVDQKWINLAPGLFPDVYILRDAGCNMAYWNLHERTLLRNPDPASAPASAAARPGHLRPHLVVVPQEPASPARYLVENPNSAPVPLRFFHFSGVVPDAPDLISRNTDRFTLGTRPDLAPIFATYLAELAANRDPRTDSLPYGFDRLSDGTAITRLARRIFAAHAAHFTAQPGQAGEPDPFQAAGPFARFARAGKLLAGAAPAARNTWREFNPQDRRVRAVHRLLRAALRILGPTRYELLMRYLAHISVLRNQGVFLKPDR